MKELQLGARPIDILSEARRMFDVQDSIPRSYITYRGLRPRLLKDDLGKPVLTLGYIDVLPTLNGENLVDLVNAEIERRKTVDGSGKVSIVDIGYGNGQFLLDCRKEWGAAVNLMGYGSDIYTTTNPGSMFETAAGEVPISTKEELDENRVLLINGNVIDIRRILGDNFADFVVSSNAFEYVKYPEWELMKKIYRVLNPNGIALLDFTFTASRRVDEITEYSNSKGYQIDANGSGVAFMKTQPDICLPIRTVQWNMFPRLRITGDSSALSVPIPLF